MYLWTIRTKKLSCIFMRRSIPITRQGGSTPSGQRQKTESSSREILPFWGYPIFGYSSGKTITEPSPVPVSYIGEPTEDVLLKVARTRLIKYRVSPTTSA